MMKQLERLINKTPRITTNGSVATERTYTVRYDGDTFTVNYYHYGNLLLTVYLDDDTYAVGDMRSQSDSRAKNELVRYYADMNYTERKEG